ncbi:MAG TPA: A/G-specific adenine glycosylase [Pseudogracilibacillus sp.]|nr:A/G-specific adenine glycosylase [Pseudogracilibacillus sp.]
MTDKALQKFDIHVFQRKLLQWYYENKRDLPWRKTNDPYKIWVSEIMLQQTKVDTVIPYYEKFMKRYPTIFDLARAKEQEVLKEWEGLGYYSRARNLLEATREVVATYEGQVPNNPKKLGALKGIGPYTKGAILSIAFQQAEPAVDGNVMRVLSRVLLIKDNISEYRVRSRFEDIVRELISNVDPASFNQGLMELGALVCTPRSPSCLLCPVQNECRAFQEGIPHQLPVKLKNKKQRVVSYSVFIIQDDEGRIAIEQRPNKGLLANMWQFPMVSQTIYEKGEVNEWLQREYGIQMNVKNKLGNVKHIFTHKIWELTVHLAQYIHTSTEPTMLFIPPEKLSDYPFSVAHLKVKRLLEEQ